VHSPSSILHSPALIHDVLSSELEDWLNDVERFGKENSVYTQYMKFPWTDQYKKGLLAQATPCLIKDWNPVVVIGKEVTIKAAEEFQSFFSGCSRSGALTLDILQCLEEIEQQAVDTNSPPADDTLPNPPLSWGTSSSNHMARLPERIWR
jgi:hypothetical protein